MVMMPTDSSRRPVTGPTPHRAPTGSGCRNPSSWSGSTTTTPAPSETPDRVAVGLAAFEASLAISLLRPTPTEQSKRSSAATRRRISTAMVGPSPNSCCDPVTSRKASSSEIPSTSGVTERKMACNRSLSSM